VADAKETNESYVKELYIKSFSIVLFFDVLLITGIIIFAPLVSYIWIGEIIPFFVFAVVINSIVVFINILSNPAYFSYLGEGKLNWLIYSYFAITILNPLLGFLLGHVYSGYGVVIAWNVSFLVSSIIILHSYNKLNSIALKTVLKKPEVVFICIATLLASFGCLSLYQYLLDYTVDFIFITIFALCFVVFMSLLIKNKNFKTLFQHAKQIVAKK
jgi:O-antigen/teichoic acid export membrane protein